MNSEGENLESALRAWIGATRGLDVPVPQTAAVNREVAQFRSCLGSPSSERRDVRSLDDDLAVVSLLSLFLIEVEEASRPALSEAEGAFQFVRTLEWRTDEFDERSELLTRFAFLAWRHSRSLGLIGTSHNWLAQYDAIAESTACDWGAMAQLTSGASLGSLAVSGGAARHDPEQLFRICSLLRSQRDVCPTKALVIASAIHSSLQEGLGSCDLFDEASAFRCESAIIAASLSRTLGRSQDCLAWLDAAKQACGNLRDEAAWTAQIAYVQLSMRYGLKNYEGLAAAAAALVSSCEGLGLVRLALKSRYLEAVTRKDLGEYGFALKELQRLSAAVQDTDHLKAWILMALAEVLAKVGRSGDSLALFREAERIAWEHSQTIVLASLRGILGESLRDAGLMDAAIEKFREAIEVFARLGLTTMVAYLRIVLGESLLALNRPEEAELEILAALPTIEERGMVPEGLSAVALLWESTRRRKTDRNALRELREHLQGKR